MKDTRPIEAIQHSFEGYGRMVMEQFGTEAYKAWVKRVSLQYPDDRLPYPRKLLQEVGVTPKSRGAEAWGNQK